MNYETMKTEELRDAAIAAMRSGNRSEVEAIKVETFKRASALGINVRTFVPSAGARAFYEREVLGKK